MSEHRITVTLECEDRQAGERMKQVMEMICSDRALMSRLEAARTERECFEVLKKYSPFSFTVFNFIYQVAIVQATRARDIVSGEAIDSGSEEALALIRNISLQVASVLQACGGMLPPNGLAIEARNEGNRKKFRRILHANGARG